MVDGELDRYGTVQHKLVSEHLTEPNIERGSVEVDYPSFELVNQDLGIHDSMLADFIINIGEKLHVEKKDFGAY